MIAAHPDDENTALLAYFARGRSMRTAYISLTRGEGGQNLIGSEQSDLLGVIRTQELLAARRIDGAEQFFTRAIDFGYSKSADETLEKWGREKVLSDIVWAIRRFRPDVILCDIGLPGLDGYEVAAALRKDPATAGARIIAITGYGRDRDRERARAAGFDGHLTKPADPADLLALLTRP